MIALFSVFIDTAVIMYCEEAAQPLPYHTWLYCIWITTATVGYGDISPVTDAGRTAVMAMIAASIVFIPMMTNELLETMAQSSVYIRAVYLPRPEHKHILVCGDMKSASIEEFFRELFHEDHENRNLYVVLLCPNPPTPEIKALLKDPLLQMQVIYLEGTSLNDDDLERAKADTAMAVFILTNKFSVVPDEEDSKTILQQFSIKRYNQYAMNATSPLYCIQLIRPENKRHLAVKDHNNDEDLVVCLNEIKMGVIAKSVMFPGTTTLIMNLLTSVNSDGPDVEETKSDSSSSDSDSEESEESVEEECNWMDEYKKGCDWEVYTTELSDMFEGGNFSKLADSMYRRLGVVLFALQVQEVANPANSRVLLNPSTYVIPSKTDFHIHGLVMAQNKTQSDLSYSALAQSLQKEGTDLKIFTRLHDMSNAPNVVQRRRGTLMSRSAHEVSDTDDDVAAGSVQRAAAGGGLQRRVKGQIALMKRFKEIKVSSDSQQEKQHKLEEEYMQNNYYMRAKVASISDATIVTSVLKEIPHINDHVIITGKGISNLYDLIRPLRARDLGPMMYIVILYPYELSHAVWHMISNFDGIFVVKGSPLEEEDIRRAGIFRAKNVVIMADSSTNRLSSETGTSKGLEAMCDAEAIFAYKAMRRMNDKANVVVEIVKQTNIGYLDQVDDLEGLMYDDDDYRFTPQFASGELFTSSLLDTIVCQAFYNPQIVAVVNKLISSRDLKEVTAAVNKVTADIHVGPGKKQSLDAVSSSSLYQMPIPKEFHNGGKYGDMFKQMAQKGILALALYRGVNPQTNRGTKMNTLPYVYTNPHESVELFEHDKVFVLSTKPVHIAHMSIEALTQQQLLSREVHNFEINKQHRGSMKHVQQLCLNWDNFITRFDQMLKDSKGLIAAKSTAIKTRVRELHDVIDFMKTMDLTLLSLLVPQANNLKASGLMSITSLSALGGGVGSGEAHIASMMSSESKRVKYAIEFYLPQIRELRDVLQNLEGTGCEMWDPFHKGVKRLMAQANGDDFKVLGKVLHIINELVLCTKSLAVEANNHNTAVSRANSVQQSRKNSAVQQHNNSLAQRLLNASICANTSSDVTANTNSNDKASSKASAENMWATSASNTSKIPAAGEVALRPSQTKLQSMENDDSDSDSSSSEDQVTATIRKAAAALSPDRPGRGPDNAALAAPSPKQKQKEEKVAKTKDGAESDGTDTDTDTDDEDPLEAFFERAKLLFGDTMDALEATVWDTCSSSAR